MAEVADELRREVPCGFIFGVANGAGTASVYRKSSRSDGVTYQFFVVITLDVVVTFGRNDHGLSCRQKRRDDAIISIIAFVGRTVCASTRGNRTSAPSRSQAWRERKANRIAQDLHRGVDLGVNPLCFALWLGLRHIFERPRYVDGHACRAVDHRVFVIGIASPVLEYLLQDAPFSPSAPASVRILPIAKPFWQITLAAPARYR